METFDRFLKNTKLKLIIMSISTLTPIIIIIVMNILGDSLINFENGVFADILKTDMIVFTYLLLALFEGAIIYKVYKYARILLNNEYANNEFIKKRDERNRFIKSQASNLIAKIFIYVLVVVTIFSAFTNRVLFYSLFFVLIIYFIIHIIVTVYYYKKY